MKTIFSGRVASVDMLRGIVMIIMALDHTRDYFSNYPFDPLDLDHPNAAWFLTRWVTHFCAPVFVFLSGSSAFLSTGRRKTKSQCARGLFTRGLWLILLELTIIRFGWEFNFGYSAVWVQVIWAIGWSMIALAGIIYLPLPAIAIIALAIILGHNALDAIKDTDLGSNAIWWDLLHQPGGINIGHTQFYVLYPVLPWIGVMAAGYCFGAILKRPPSFRDFWCYAIGISAILLFVLLRWSNSYGDPHPWKPYPEGWQTLLSFIRCEKYPPSLLFLLMTLGPAIAIIPLLERLNKKLAAFISIYGSVPLFYYILHIYLIHAAALVTGLVQGFPLGYFTTGDTSYAPAHGWGFPLPVVYGIWIAIVLLMYFPCKWFRRIKQADNHWWISYL